MAVREFFRRMARGHGTSVPRPPSPHAPALKTAPAYQPVLVAAADPVDAELRRLWLAYQATRSAPSWHDFLQDLAAHNKDLDTRIARLESDLKIFGPASEFKP